ncbi:hypothetical protein [Shewanella sp. SR44-3]|uniref:hypothetical protein n=2 Tax=Shewanella TaxID=22 RepID=UPI0015FA161D|nr:hypothetical protein [Shewanella sp. SR44-3]MBB1268796.1 hypothetical protein [Shewanella sp. SR44-3]
MFRCLFVFLAFSCNALAAPSMYQVLSQGTYQTPISVMKQLEAVKGDMIVAFDMEIEADELIYEFMIVNLAKQKLIETRIRAKDGVKLKDSSKTIAADDLDQVQALKMLQKKQLSFSDLVNMAIKNQPGFLLEAELDHDLAISYLELKLLTEQSKNTIAFDIDNLRPLPLLKWD